jgi:hypothetical protein
MWIVVAYNGHMVRRGGALCALYKVGPHNCRGICWDGDKHKLEALLKNLKHCSKTAT